MGEIMNLLFFNKSKENDTEHFVKNHYKKRFDF